MNTKVNFKKYIKIHYFAYITTHSIPIKWYEKKNYFCVFKALLGWF